MIEFTFGTVLSLFVIVVFLIVDWLYPAEDAIAYGLKKRDKYLYDKSWVPLRDSAMMSKEKKIEFLELLSWYTKDKKNTIIKD